MNQPQDASRPAANVSDPNASTTSRGARNALKKARKTYEAQDDVPVAAVAHAVPERVNQARERAVACARLADESRAREVAVLDVRGVTSLVDYMVLATVVSRRQANALAIEIDMAMKRQGERKLGLEGSEEGRWILIDYGDFLVHVFSEDARAYYGLDDLWGDAPHVEWAEAVVA